MRGRRAHPISLAVHANHNKTRGEGCAGREAARKNNTKKKGRQREMCKLEKKDWLKGPERGMGVF